MDVFKTVWVVVAVCGAVFLYLIAITAIGALIYHFVLPIVLEAAKMLIDILIAVIAVFSGTTA